MTFDKYNARFIDSIHVLLQPLRKKTASGYYIDAIKGQFPHVLNRPEHRTYTGCVPDAKMFGVKNMSPEEYEKYFTSWYNQQQDITDCNVKTEFIKCRRADAGLLSNTVLYVRKLFTYPLDTDPFRSTTLASLCISTYLNNFLPDKTIVGKSHGKKNKIQPCVENG